MDIELAADSGAGLAGEVTPLGLTFLLITQATRPTGDAAGIAEVADLLLADVIALTDFSHWYTLLVQGDHLILLRRREAGVMLAGERLWWSWWWFVGAPSSGGNVLANSRSACQFLVGEVRRAPTSSVYEPLGRWHSADHPEETE